MFKKKTNKTNIIIQKASWKDFRDRKTSPRSERCLHWRRSDCWGAAASGKDLGRLQHGPGLQPALPQSHSTRHWLQLLPIARINAARFLLQRCLAMRCLFSGPSNKGLPWRSQMMEMSSPHRSWAWFKSPVLVVHFYYMRRCLFTL